MTASKALRALREAIVLELLDSENEQEFDTAVGAFDHPRCEVVSTGQVFEGREEVAGYYARVLRAVPDRRSTLVALHHADDAAIAELEVAGTYLGGLGGGEPAGRPFRVRTTAFFLFDGARLVGQRLYGEHGCAPDDSTTGTAAEPALTS
ncbi:nuclear transport factor 2 family protein [Saccharothrix longispora]|uniref:nuclear transport factor 2 family protein n=1 Tax=Saccharothrix longispora TaxID=33920 RepID=UPI0028FDA9AC|nr:nuclear transport factor 2 family protein [Saccharothrix longispora]MBY8853095.1 nuclear transport factor 2 family protein [Saccharothrix sp. MB29]MDU0289864.1 nuclear transport factor 2 family protein [Saccharothrix longispora]